MVQDSFYLVIVTNSGMTPVSMVREKSEKKYFFKVRLLSGNFVICNKLKVREKSGNFERKSQGILKCKVKTYRIE